jgi:translation initiation factor eIF-2B subunit delta
MSEEPAVEAGQVPAAAEQNSPNTSQPPPATNGDATNAPKKISAAELKKQAKAEKQARRAQAKSEDPAPNKQPATPKDGQKHQREDKSRPMPVRRRPSQTSAPVAKEPEKKPKKEPKQTEQSGLFFGHLYSQPKQQSIHGASKDVHPAILALGLQYSSYAICGSTARMVAMLMAFKAVIGVYQTPQGNSLARHLTSHHLSPQIEYLKSCRSLSVSMGNAIRWLKDCKLYTTLRRMHHVFTGPVSELTVLSDHQNRPFDTRERG